MKQITQMAAKEYLSTLLREHAGNITHVARTAGLNRWHVYRLMNRYGLDYQGQRVKV